MNPNQSIHGRGAAGNPKNRFEAREYVPEMTDDLVDPEGESSLQTQFFPDQTKSIIARNDSPDIGFDMGINVYRGCEHGCSYCYARPYHEYLGMSAGLDFESKIFVKYDAPELLRKALENPKYAAGVIAMSGITDCYQPAEKKFELTRGCLKVMAEYKNPTVIITKNALVTRDIDVLAEMAAWGGACVIISVTTLRPDLGGRLEPRASRPQARLDAITKLAAAGIPVGVNAAPMIPGLTDTELPAIVAAAAEAGASFANYTVVRLPGAVEAIFQEWLEQNEPGSVSKVMNHIRSVHDGRAKDSRFGTRMRGDGLYADQISGLFKVSCKKAGLTGGAPPLSADQFKRPSKGQLDLFS